ncbi:hypothetical protein A6R68_07662 [Neotoma lepida]|uniref:E3 ubiquitin-protein ligase n=1 Tax=Neotoma lepida TaxID=56216 RepID=A0A1A6GD70_NEOLE|nr:hypothetical protein A6R68_07662 [Neotoma lepida]
MFGMEDNDIQANSTYHYPLKSGNYFASHFFMGAKKFDSPCPEIVIQTVVDDMEVTGHEHMLLAAFEKYVGGSFSVKPFTQKQVVDLLSYLLQEIYSTENKNNQETKPSDDENSDNSIQAVLKKPGVLSPISFSSVLAQSVDHDEHSSSLFHLAMSLSSCSRHSVVYSLFPQLSQSAPLYEKITYSGILDGLSQASCPLNGLD